MACLDLQAISLYLFFIIQSTRETPAPKGEMSLLSALPCSDPWGSDPLEGGNALPCPSSYEESPRDVVPGIKPPPNGG